MQASPSGPGERVAVGSVANVLGFATTTVLALLLTPYLLHHLGASAFGAWALVGVVVTVLQLADLGLPRALSRTVAEAYAQGNAVGLWVNFGTTLFLYLIISSVVALLLIATRGPLVAYGLAVPEPWQADARFALVWMACGLLPALVTSALGATLDGLQRMEWTNLALVTGRATYAGGAVMAVLTGNGLRGLAIAMVVATLCQMTVATLGLWIVAFYDGSLSFPRGRHALPSPVHPRWIGAQFVAPLRRHLSLKAARSLLAYGLPILANAAVGLAYVPWSKLVLARAAPVEMVGYYEVASTFAMQIFLLAWALAMAAFPALAQAWGTTDHARVHRLYGRANRWGVMATLPAGIALILVAAPLLRAWLGLNILSEAVPTLQLVAVGWTLVALAAPSAVTLQAIGRPAHTLYAVLANGLTSAFLCLVLAPRYKLVGVAAANLASALVGSLLMIWLCRRALGLPTLPRVTTFLRPAASALWAPVVPALLLALTSVLLARQPSPSLVALFLAGGGYAVLYGVCCFAWGPLAKEERDWLRRHLPIPPLRGPTRGDVSIECQEQGGRRFAVYPFPGEERAKDEDVNEVTAALKSPLLSIIIVNWNVLPRLRACLASIHRETAGSALHVETIVVDNASAESPVEALRREFPQVCVIANDQNLGFARACNQGLAQAQGRYLLLLNPDTEVRPGALAQLIACLDSCPRAGACGPLIRTPSGQIDYLGGRRFPTPWSQALDWAGITRRWPRLAFHLIPTWDHLSSRAVECLSGAALMLRREALADVGLLDPAYHLYGEDMDLCFRLVRAGWELRYCAEAEIVHWGGESSKQIKPEAALWAQRGNERFFRKHYGLGAVLLHRIFIFLISAVKATLFAGAGLVQPLAARRSHLWREARAHALMARWALVG